MEKLTLTTVLLGIALTSFSQKSAIFQTDSGAINGYDPVSYFTDGAPMKGKQEHSLEWSGVTWYFANKEHLELFKTNPESYAPQYGGYCAYSIAKGYAAKVDALAWKIVDGKLYLNYNASVKKNWEEYQEKYIAAAEKNWPEVLQD